MIAKPKIIYSWLREINVCALHFFQHSGHKVQRQGIIFEFKHSLVQFENEITGQNIHCRLRSNFQHHKRLGFLDELLEKRLRQGGSLERQNFQFVLVDELKQSILATVPLISRMRMFGNFSELIRAARYFNLSNKLFVWSRSRTTQGKK